MTIVHRHNATRERAIIVKHDGSGAISYVLIRRDDETLFTCIPNNERSIYNMIDQKIFQHIMMHETTTRDYSMQKNIIEYTLIKLLSKITLN